MIRNAIKAEIGTAYSVAQYCSNLIHFRASSEVYKCCTSTDFLASTASILFKVAGELGHAQLLI